MADVFISYARADEPVARRFAENFSAEGFDVWWDDDLRSGEVFDETIEAALRAAKAVIVLWSPASVRSRWVRAEATLADRNKTLIPAMITPCERPIIFELMHTADMSGWQGDATDKVWQSFAGHVREFLGKIREAKPAAQQAKTPLPRLDQTSIAVLPFANMSSDPEQDYFADGITEDVITDLSKVSALGVIARNTAFTFKGRHVDVVDVARQLNVTHVLEGSVRKSGNRVRVTAQLIDGSNNNHVWADRWDRNLDDIFELQDELSKSIVDALKVKLLPSEAEAISDRGTSDVEAYDLYQRGFSLYMNLDDGPALAYVRAALAKDPEFNRAWRFLGFATFISSYTMNDAGLLEESDAAFEKAIATSKDSYQAEMANAVRLTNRQGQWIEAGKAFERASKLRKSATQTAEDSGWIVFLAHLGRFEEAIEESRNIFRLDPLGAAPLYFMLLDIAGRQEDADAEYERQFKLTKHHHTIAFFDLLRSMHRRSAEQVKLQFKNYLAMDNQILPRGEDILAQFDSPAEVCAILRAISEAPATRTASNLSNLAPIAAYFGDQEMALEFLRAAFVDMRGSGMTMMWNPLLADLRKSAGFRAILRDLGIADYWRETGNWGDFARPVGDEDFEIIA